MYRTLWICSSSHQQREQEAERKRRREIWRPPPGEIATYRMCWQHAAAEINSVKRSRKHPSPAPLHTPLIWDDTQETGWEAAAEQGGDVYFLRYWHYHRLAPCHVCSVRSLFEQAMKCVPLCACFLSSCSGCQEENRKLYWCISGRETCRPEAVQSDLVVSKKKRKSSVAGLQR